jgi:hypothetical protein
MIDQTMDSTFSAHTKLKAQIVPARALTLAHKVRMFELMQTYYEQVTREQFLKDLAKKDDVILLVDERNQQIQGFSTLMKISIRQKDKEWRAIFSGDTVIDKSFWGQRALGKAFLGYLFKEKLRQPWQPLYWLLITKGYKTYLMMANNFTEYYPRFDQPTPADKKALIDTFYLALYPGGYDVASGLIHPNAEACHVKTGVANISPLLVETNPKIAFFQRVNPGWQEGVELACIARMTLWMPFQYALKSFVVDRLVKPIVKLVHRIGPSTVKPGTIEKRLR